MQQKSNKPITFLFIIRTRVLFSRIIKNFDFYRACIVNTIAYCEEPEVKCPYRDAKYTCESTLQEREIKAVSFCFEINCAASFNKVCDNLIIVLCLACRAGSLSATSSEVNRASGKQRWKQGFPLQDAGLSWLVYL